MLGIMRNDVKLLGTTLNLDRLDIVHLTPATNQPNGDGRYFARPWNCIWPDGIERNPDDSILLDKGDVKPHENKRSPEWMEELGPGLDELPEDTRLLVENGSIEICPICHELSAYSWYESDAYDECGDIIPGGFKPKPGTIAHIGTASGDEWECGHCKARLMDANSPLNHPAYTHSED